MFTCRWASDSRESNNVFHATGMCACTDFPFPPILGVPTYVYIQIWLPSQHSDQHARRIAQAEFPDTIQNDVDLATRVGDIDQVSAMSNELALHSRGGVSAYFLG